MVVVCAWPCVHMEDARVKPLTRVTQAKNNVPPPRRRALSFQPATTTNLSLLASLAKEKAS